MRFAIFEVERYSPHMSRMRWAVLVLILAMGGPGTRAQSPCEACVGGHPPEDTVSTWLRSGEPRLVAWGATFALQRKDELLIPEMVGLARNWSPLPRQAVKADGGLRPRTDEEMQRGDAMAAVLDALIQMHVTLDLDVLRLLAADFPAQAIVMAARMPPEEVQPVLMEWLALPSKPEGGRPNASLRRSAAAMLALHPAPGFAAELMRGTHAWMTLAVTTPDGEGTGRTSVGDCGAGAVRAARLGWPVLNGYGVRESHHDDPAEILIPGIDPIRVNRGPQVGAGCGFGVYLNDRQRGRLIAQMLGIAPKDLAWGQHGVIRITYRSDAQFVGEVQAKMEAEEQAIQDTLQTLEDKGLITGAERASALPQVEVWAWDQRRTEPNRLPQPAFRYANIHWNDGENSWEFDQRW